MSSSCAVCSVINGIDAAINNVNEAHSDLEDAIDAMGEEGIEVDDRIRVARYNMEAARDKLYGWRKMFVRMELLEERVD